jgi:hypothetical protein
VAEIEAQMFSFAQKINRKTELEFIHFSPHDETHVVGWPYVQIYHLLNKIFYNFICND